MVGAEKLTNVHDMPNLLIRIICLTMHTESVKSEKRAVLEKKKLSQSFAQWLKSMYFLNCSRLTHNLYTYCIIFPFLENC